MFKEEIRRQAEAAPRAALPAVAAAVWRALTDGRISEAEAEELSGLIEARKTSSSPKSSPADPGIEAVNLSKSVGSRPRTDASLERRRRWAASGRLPPALAARFTLAEQSVLALVAAEVARRKDCRLAIENIAAVAGVSRSTVKNAIREAVRLGLVLVEHREITGWRNDTNVITIVSPEWTAWLRLTRKRKDETLAVLPGGGGVKSLTGTSTSLSKPGNSGITAPLQKLPRGSERPQSMRTAGNCGAR